MKKIFALFSITCLFVGAILINNTAFSQVNSEANWIVNLQSPSLMTPSSLVPPAPELEAASYLLMDVNSGKILAQKNMNQQREPASLTKLMTLYLVFGAIENGTINLNDLVPISHKAWEMGGSRMFVKAGTHVSVNNLIQGVTVDSGNDATIALAEFVGGGSESNFVKMMNQAAKTLGMNQTHFADSTGLPNPENTTTAYDLALLARALIHNYPKEYHYFGQKWFSYSGIKQPNRDRLLWRLPGTDGLKTGDTDKAGFCLISSAVQNNTRLLSVVMGTPSDEARATESITLMRYGFSHFETHALYAANAPMTQLRVWRGDTTKIPVGVTTPLYITIPRGQFSKISTHIQTESDIQAPVALNQPVGILKVTLEGNLILSEPLVALKANPIGGKWRQTSDAMEYKILNWFKKSKTSA